MTLPTEISVNSSMPAIKASTLTGMGAIPYKTGTAFRVWAPFASAVYVAGDFNNWSTSANLLTSENNGYWSVDVPGAKEGQKYRYVIQSPFIPADSVWWRTDPYCKHVLDNEGGDGVIVTDQFDWGTNTFNMPAWNELVIYELHVASFNRSENKPGDLNSIIDKLGTLKDLGINAIELMPIFGFPGEYSLGYNPAFPFDIESNYGDPSEFKNFVKKAHEFGIAVILDVVYNHFGSEELDYSLRRFDGWNQNNGDGIYFYNDQRVKTDFGPRPDYGRGEVRQYIRDNALMWLEEYQIDGLRFDSTVNIRNIYGKNNEPGNDIPEGWSLMQWINNEIDSKTPWKITIAEDLQNNEWINRNTGAGGAGFDSQWGSSFYYSIFEAVVAPSDSARNMYSVRDAILQRFETDAWKRVIYSENHDEVAEINRKVRLPEVIWRGNADSWFARKRSTLAAALVFTSPGIPMIFQGQEFLEWGSWSDSGTLDWSKKDRFSGIWDLYQSLIRLRRNWYNNTRGLRGQHVNVHHVNNNDKVIAFHRWDNGGPGDDVVVIVNMGDRSYDRYSLGFPGGGTWWVRFNSDWNGYSPDFGNHSGYDTFADRSNPNDSDGMSFRANVGIGPYSVLILSQ
ncbi:MAG: alpha amylase C-terminal domain-containing protein [Nostoc desertorum CM1-VF14]|nr:alpha amylase C-terminal domain-containing protein [Nostoc desertorum CM1-VF14]